MNRYKCLHPSICDVNFVSAVQTHGVTLATIASFRSKIIAKTQTSGTCSTASTQECLVYWLYQALGLDPTSPIFSNGITNLRSLHTSGTKETPNFQPATQRPVHSVPVLARLQRPLPAIRDLRGAGVGVLPSMHTVCLARLASVYNRPSLDGLAYR